LDELNEFRQNFIETKIKPIFLERAQDCINKHKENGDTVLVITASNTFITSPIVEMYGIDHFLATEPEFKSGRFTGKVSGIPCFQSGKIDNLMPWLDKNGENLIGSYFYSDSHNDLPLLELVDNPVAINSDKVLTSAARENGWPVLDWR
jgi:HAD superfamily hydrolase (TIGR01490 family)